MGEILIKNGGNGYLIPGVHCAPEITLNILSINLLKQKGFGIIFEEDKCTLEYMFKNQQGQNMDIDKMRQMHNDFLDDYFKSLDKEIIDREGEEPSVQFGQELGALAEILGLTRSDGEEIRKCYMTSLEVFISYYKTARAPEDPIRGGEDSESLESYQWNDGKTCAPIAVEKGQGKNRQKRRRAKVCGRYKRIRARALEDPIRGGEDSESLESYQWNDGKTCTPIAVEKG
uniref:ARID DNA-binding domain-containing protein n=1 Tax=Tanacetum cinerariifolium TaxID=118510 RepID=A0A6L2JAU0_TANCI|nr:ARID DNA-binding domain-containing protein [Tanacetum cinerariifolium]